VITRYAVEIAVSMLADFLMLGNTGTGTQALATEKIDVFTTALKSWLSIIAGEFNKKAIPRLMKLNGHKGAMPKLVHGDITTKSVNDFMANLRNLAVSGLTLFPDNVLENEIRSKMGLSHITPEDAKIRDENAMGEVKNNPEGTIPHGETGGKVAVSRPKKPRLKNRELTPSTNRRNGVSDG
jgi:hypothetical protein